MIEPADIEELLQLGFTRMVGPWCEENNVKEKSLLWVAQTLGMDPHPPAIIVISAFQCGYEARKRNEPTSGGTPCEEPKPLGDEGRHVVQHVVVNTDNDEVVAGPNPHFDFVKEVAAKLNVP